MSVTARPAIATRLGTINAKPRNTLAAAVKTGLRTSWNGPVVTSVVCSVWLTPIRQEAPSASWEPKVARMPNHEHDAQTAHDRVVDDGQRRRAGQRGDRRAEPHQQVAEVSYGEPPPFQRAVCRPGAPVAGVAGAAALDQRAHSASEGHEDDEQGQGGDGHHPSLPVGTGFAATPSR